MAESYMCFDSELVNGEPDRAVPAAMFRKYFHSFVSSGVFAEKGNALQVLARTPNVMQVVVKSGQAFTEGAFYDNDDDLVLSIQPADSVLNRIDAVVVQCNYVDRTVTCKIVTGTPATNPAHYTPKRNVDAFELVLAEIYVGFAVINIKQANITDYRADSNVCGWVTGYLQQIDASSFFNQYQQAFSEFMEDAKHGFSGQIDTINSWYSTVKDDISLLQYFDFDNLAAYPNCKYTMTDAESLPEGHYQKGFRETITSLSTNKPLAVRVTEYPTSDTITVEMIRYSKDGTTILDDTVQTYNLGETQEVNISGYVENVYTPSEQ